MRRDNQSWRWHQEPTRAKLAKDLQKICVNCRSAYERFLKQLQPVKDAFADPTALAKQAHRLASRPEYRQTFKPDKLCGDVGALISRLSSNLDPLKYSIAVNRINTLHQQLVAFQNYDSAFYLTFDRFAADLGRTASDLQLALANKKSPRNIAKLQKQIRQMVEKLEAEISSTLRQVMETHAQVQI
jgi:hypothetical protein